ncbi:efflux transporter outer membrane subunit [Amantichitinum ursilacus]|uniref:Outer membrane protein OprM n=1 Tax=Amantichitinum ursilacus TaxID=857265 RepID=A0A0N0GR25_9NEIS|nr:efflux transporter outer membrane subunit [Amantichitinum ursilacus]KPC55420.1 Outer membrane protein OprM precursor [Amantichitinum ursilacus]
MTRAALILTSAATLTLSACSAFGPERNPPAMPSPEHYAVQASALPTADGVTQEIRHDITPVPAWWQAYQSAALNALVEEGLAHNQSLAAARHNLQAAREQLRSQIGDNLYPAVDVGFKPQRQRALALPTLPQQTFVENVFAAQVQTSYTFDFFGAALLADRALAEQVQQQAFQLEATRRAIAANIVAATINVGSLQAQLDATTELVRLGEARAEQMQQRYQAGSASHDDALAAEQDAANAAATLPTLRAQWLAVRHAQAVLLGRTPDQAPDVVALSDLHLPTAVPVSVPTELLHQRPDILAAEAAVRTAADAAGAATASMFPSLTLSASYGRGGFDWSTFTSPAGVIWGVGASLTQPIFHGGALVARKHQYEASYTAAVSQYKQTVLSAFQNVADTLVSLEEDANTLNQTERAAAAAQQTASNTTSRYQLGALPFYATLTAGQQYQNAQVQSIRARAARLADTATLYDAMGNPPEDYAGNSLRQTVRGTP